MTNMRTTSLPQVRRRRLATQRLSAAGLPHGGDVVRLLTAVQSQDAPLAAWSLAMRMPPGTTYAGLLAEQAAGGWVRTHVLRPTWHHVAPEDLRWMQRATLPWLRLFGLLAPDRAPCNLAQRRQQRRRRSAP